MNNYTLGLLFNSDLTKVLLINKTKPDWQKGKINGIGGKVEVGESHFNCMIREFQEEAGLSVSWWDNFTTIKGDTYYMSCWVAKGAPEAAVTQTEEEVILCDVGSLPKNVLRNIRWLVPMAINFLETKSDYFKIEEL